MVCFHKGHLSVDSLIYNKSVCSPRRNNMSVEKDLRPTGSSTHSLAKIVTIDDLFTSTGGLWVGTIISEVWKLIFHPSQEMEPSCIYWDDCKGAVPPPRKKSAQGTAKSTRYSLLPDVRRGSQGWTEALSYFLETRTLEILLLFLKHGCT